MQRISALLVLVTSAFLGAYALILSGTAFNVVTITASQSVLKSALFYAAFSVLADAVFLVLARGWLRLVGIIPTGLYAAAFWKIAQAWPVAFS